MKAPKPTSEDLADAVNRTVPDLIAPDLKVLFCGINPGLYSGATGLHFARPGNRFWKVLHLSGFTERQLDPSEENELLASGYGITCFVDRSTARADELSKDRPILSADPWRRWDRSLPDGLFKTKSRRRASGWNDRRDSDLAAAKPQRPQRKLPARGLCRAVHRDAIRDQIITV